MIKFTVSTFLTLFCLLTTVTARIDYPKDREQLGSTGFKDPNDPQPVIGDRQLWLDFVPPQSWTQIKVFLEHSLDSEDFLLDDIAPGATVVATSLETRPDSFRSTHILPWEKPRESSIWDKPSDAYAANSQVYYRWRIEYTESGQESVARGDLHVFTMPRRITVAILGDSYGSGEGAPNMDPALGGNWQYFNEGSRGHRSPISGQELSLAEFFTTRPHLAYDYVNLSSSGAIAVDIYSDRSQHQRLLDAGIGPDEGDTKERAVRFAQANKLSEWLTARQYPALDTIILSCGGNDLGFAAILTAYLGINADILSQAALDSLLNPRCIALGVGGSVFATPTIGILAYISCIIGEIVEASQSDHTFTDPYFPGKDSAAITTTSWLFSQYANRLDQEYFNLANEFANNLRNGSTPVPTYQVLATSYPFPLKDSPYYYEAAPILGVLSDDTLLEFTIDPSALPFFNDPYTFEFDYSHLFGLFVGISPAETLEANTKLAPPADASRPSVGGMNHFIQDFVSRNDARFATDWNLVKVNNFLPANTGLYYSGRHFNTLDDAVDLAGPNRKTNAFHPNARGHNGHYRPAILDSLERNLTTDFLAKSAAGEGLLPADVPRPDLAFQLTPKLTYDFVSGNLRVEADIINRGNVNSPDGLFLHPLLNDQVPNPSFDPITLPSLSVGESYTLEFELQIPALPVANELPFQCAGAPFPGFGAFADRDYALRYFFSNGIATLKLRLNPELEANEINRKNNIFEDDLDVRAELSDPNLSQIVSTVLNQLSGILNRPVATVTKDLLIQSEDVRIYFGFFSPELLSGKTLGEIITELAQFNRDFCLAQNLGTQPPFPPTYDREPTANLRPICLFPPPLLDCGQTENSLLRDSLGRLQSFREFLANAPRDGRNVTIAAVLDEQLADLFGNPLLELALNTPSLNSGIKSPIEGNPIDGPAQTFLLSPADGAVATTIRLGSVSGAGNFMGTRRFVVEKETTLPITTSQLPQDGRKVHATVTTFFENGSTGSESYTYDTTRRNALLTSPEPNSLLEPNKTVVSWDAPNSAVAGPVQAYSLAIGTFPGNGDIVPGGLEGGLDLPDDGSQGDQPQDSFLQFLPSQTSYILPDLPSDGRTVYLTLGTLRDGEWSYELHEREIGPTENTGILLPKTNQLIHSRESFILSPGNNKAKAYRLTLGTSDGGNELFDSRLIDSRQAGLPIPVVLDSYVPQLDDQRRPLPIYATVESIQEGVSSVEKYQLVPSPNASLFQPNRATPLAQNDEITFAWSPGADAEGYRLKIFASLSDEDPVFEEEFDSETFSAPFAIEAIPGNRNNFIAVIETLRSPRSESLPTGSTSTAFLVDRGQYNFYDDTISDLWQIENFGPENPDGLANADPDGDGQNNLAEFLARTNPNDPNDFFKAILVKGANGEPNSLLIEKPVPSTKYQIRKSLDLSIWTNQGPAISPAEGANTFTIPLPLFPIPNEPKNFFHLELGQ